jgi:hypothetical protein
VAGSAPARRVGPPVKRTLQNESLWRIEAPRQAWACEGVVWTLHVVLDYPPPSRFPDVVEAPEQVLIDDLLAQGPLEALDVDVLVRLAGPGVLVAMPWFFARLTNSSTRNSGPLSTLSTVASPRSASRCSRMRTRRIEVVDASNLMWSASRLKSSTTLNSRNHRPQASPSLMKSVDQTSSGVRGTYGGTCSRLRK